MAMPDKEDDISAEALNCNPAELTSLKNSAGQVSLREFTSDPSIGTKVKVRGEKSVFCAVLRCICNCLCSEDSTSKTVPLLPKHTMNTFGKKTLVLDLDETLVFCSLKPHPKPDAIIPISLKDSEAFVYLKKRPGLNAFLRKASELYELVIFTASMSRYALPVITEIDPEGYISHALFREHCEAVPNGFVKDLSRLGRNVHEIILMDVRVMQNSPLSYSLQPNNGLPISSFYGDDSDKELSRVFPVLRTLSNADDIFPILQAYRDMKATQTYIRASEPSRSTTKAEMSVL